MARPDRLARAGIPVSAPENGLGTAVTRSHGYENKDVSWLLGASQGSTIAQTMAGVLENPVRGQVERAYIYTLVQVKNKLSPPREPLAISSQRVSIWYHADPHDQWKVWHGQFFFNGLRLSLGVKFASTNDRPSNFTTIFRRFSSGGVCGIVRAKKSNI